MFRLTAAPRDRTRYFFERLVGVLVFRLGPNLEFILVSAEDCREILKLEVLDAEPGT